jgi:hypothetical protein
LVYGKAAVGASLHVKMSYARVSLIEVEEITMRGRTGRQQLRMFTFTDYLHVHPLRMQARDGT